MDEEPLPSCLGCGFPLRPFQYSMGVCTDCVQASQLRDQAPAAVTGPGYRWQQKDE